MAKNKKTQADDKKQSEEKKTKARVSVLTVKKSDGQTTSTETSPQSVSEKRQTFIEELKVRKAEQRANSRRRRVIMVLCIVLAVVILSSVGYAVALHVKYSRDGTYLRREVCMFTDDVSVDNAMMTYFVKSSYLSDLDLYGDEFEDNNLDPDKKLSEQSFQDGTWLDVYLTSAEEQVEMMLVLAQAATDAGVVLDEYDTARIQTTMDSGMDARMDPRITEDDMRRCLELLTLASKYQQILMNSFSYTDAQYEEIYEASPADFELYDCIRCELYFDTLGGENVAQEWAQTFTQCHSADEFNAALTRFYMETGGEMTEEQATQRAEDCTLYNCTYTYDDVGDWAFEENRLVGDTYVYNDQTNQRLLVFYMLRLPSRSEQRTVNVRQILFTPSVYGSIAGARSQAQSVLSEWGTDTSERHFENLAHEYSEDSTTRSRGGLYEAVYPGSMNADVEAWCFDSARQTGDTGIVESEDGIHLIYFVGEGLVRWKAMVDEKQRSDDYEIAYANLREKYTVTYVGESLEHIDI